MKQTMLLNGKWETTYASLYYTDDQFFAICEKDESDWFETPVPGDIHQGLIGAGKIPEPLLGLNSYESEWTAERAWWWRYRFNPGPDMLEREVIELELNGLDCNAMIFLNGRLIGEHRNAFRPFIKDVREILKNGDNEILVRLTAGVEDVTQSEVHGPDNSLANTEAGNGRPDRGDARRNQARRPQYAFGWDWSPKCPTTAIAGDVLLRGMNRACVRDVALTPKMESKNSATVQARVTVDVFHPWSTCEGTIAIKLIDAEGKAFTAKWSGLLRSGLNYIKCEIKIENPRLWWPTDMGEAHLYRVETDLTIEARQCDYPGFDWGMRFIELDTGGTFAFIINGRKVFAKGANWIPADTIYARVRDRDYEILIEEAVGANFNMLRIWGGGLYERDVFFQTCDRMGIMVWHDFMFACAPYPDYIDSFRREIELEADYQTRRLRKHASMVLWCGNNEIHWGFRDWPNLDTTAGAYCFNYILPAAVEKNCPEIPFWNSSPYGGEAPNCHEVGDRHHWFDCMMNGDMEKRIIPEEYDKATTLFLSEFGYVGACNKETTLAYLDGTEPDPASDVWQHHTNAFEKDTVAAGIKKHYIDPGDLTLDDYLLYSGLTQGLMLRHALDSTRFRDNCHGCLFWMYNDCWGEVGWTIIDYYRRRKISYYFVRQAYEPVRLIARRDGDTMRVVAANDTPHDEEMELQVGYISLDGSTRDLKTLHVTSEANTRTQLAEIPISDQDLSNGLWVAWPVENPRIHPAILRAIDFRQLEMSEPEIDLAVEDSNDDTCIIRVTAKTYAHAVHFELPNNALALDAYFDLLPGESRQIVIDTTEALEPNDIKVRSIY